MPFVVITRRDLRRRHSKVSRTLERRRAAVPERDGDLSDQHVSRRTAEPVRKAHKGTSATATRPAQPETSREDHHSRPRGGYGHSYGYNSYGYNSYSYNYYRPTYRTYYTYEYTPSYSYGYSSGY
jgi:hypothetical protein